MSEATLSDRRRSPRTAVNRPVALVVDSDRSRIANNAFALDLSDLGARILSRLDLQPGQLVTVIANEGTGEPVPSQVIWVGRRGSGGSGEIGLAFLHPLGAGA